jgi:hydratase-aldolase
MNVSPFYVNVTEAELVGYWRDLGEACPDIGLIVYNNPHTAQLHTVETFKELAKIPSMCGSKEITTIKLQLDIMRHTDLTPMTATELDYFYTTMRLGAKGVFSMSASMFPRFIVSFYKTCVEGRWEEAQRMQYKLRDVWTFMDGLPFAKGYGSISRFKCCVNAFGVLDCGITRKPFIPVPLKIQEQYREALRERFPELIEA